MHVVSVNISYFRSLFIIVSLVAYQFSAAQELSVVSKSKAFKKQVANDSLHAMVSLNNYLPSASFDLRYATTENFTGQKLETEARKLRREEAEERALHVAEALVNVQKELAKDGYNLKIWDAYRPYAVTRKMWELIGDERYVANPAKGSGHNRGLAIDLTLIKEGKEVAMGTGFDNFSDTAHHEFSQLPEDVLHNRKRLKAVMEKHGFRALETEWWHYSWPNDRNYDVLDLRFKDLRKLNY